MRTADGFTGLQRDAVRVLCLLANWLARSPVGFNWDRRRTSQDGGMVVVVNVDR